MNKFSVVLNIFIALIEEAYVNSRMEKKTHWVFDYIMNEDKEKNNYSNKNGTEMNFFNADENQKLNNQNSNYKSSRSQENELFHVKDKKNKESHNKPVVGSFNNNNYPKSFNVKGCVSKNLEVESLSYKSVFSWKKSKNNSHKSIINNNSSLNNSLSSSNFNQNNNFDPNKLLQSSNENMNIQNTKGTEIERNKMLPPKSETRTNMQIANNLNTFKSKENQNQIPKKTVRFSNSNQVIVDDAISNLEANSNKRYPLNNNNSTTIKKILKKDDANKDLKNTPKQGSLNDLYDKKRIKKELNQEFQKIFNDLEYLEKYSINTMANSPGSIIDDLRVAFLDFTNNLELKKNQVKNNLDKN